MDDGKKPHKGEIKYWTKVECDAPGLGYIITGRFMDHPRFAMMWGHTSWVVAHDEKTGEIETRNTRYTLVDEETVIPTE